MSIETYGNGGIVATGKSVRTFQLLALASAVSLEGKGFKRRGRSALSIAKTTTGMRTNDRTKQIDRLRAMARENEAQEAKPMQCPLCNAMAVYPVATCETKDGRPLGSVDVSDGTTHICFAPEGGCDHGFAMKS